MHIDVTCAYFHAKAQRLVLVRFPVEDGMVPDAGEIGLLRQSMHGTRNTASKWERDWQEHVKSSGDQLGLSLKKVLRHEGHRVSGMTHGDDFVVTGRRSPCRCQEQNCRGVFHRNTIHQLRINGNHQGIEQKVALVKAMNCVSP